MEAWKHETSRLLAIFFSLLIATATANETAPFGPFLLKESVLVTKTAAGEIRLFRGSEWNGSPARMHMVIATMEPNSLLIPHYMDADLVIFLQTGEAKIGWIYKDNLVEHQLKPGGILRIPAGSNFYFVNTHKDHRVKIIASIAPVDADLVNFFFISGGVSPPSIFNGFDINTLTSAFNATPEEVGLLTSASYDGSIIFITGEEDIHLHQATDAMKLAAEKFKNSRCLAQDDYEKIEMEDKEKKRNGASTWASILSSIFFGEATIDKNMAKESPHAYNVFDQSPDFENDYGWSKEININDYSPLEESDISVFFVNLSAGSMMAPHLNPRATEYGVVTAGSGTVEVVYPNGTAAMKANVREGDVFWVPRFYPFCQVAAREGPMEIVGFTTSVRRNRPQFLAGKSSILRSMVGKKLAPAFGMTEEELRHLVGKQTESVILPGW